MNFKKIRVEKELSVRQLSELTGLHRRTIEGIEKRNDCMMSNAILIADAMGVTLDELCREENN